MEILAIDVGGTVIKYALMNEKSEFIEKGSFPTPQDTIENFVESIGMIYDKYQERISGIAMSMPGRIDSERGYLYTGGALEYNSDKNIVEILNKRCPKRITVENDGKCAALAEAWKGNLSDCDDGIVVILGTAIGGGIIKDKKLHKGKQFMAGELSFIITENEIKNDESLDIFATQSGVPELCRLVAESKNLKKEEVNGYVVFEYANNGDEKVLEILNEYCFKIAIQLHNLKYIYDPEKIAIGGGISKQDILLEYIQKNINIISKKLPYIIAEPKIVRCRFDNDSNLIGALSVYMTSMN